jgi:ABC-type antimicrobial peptide transport system permease subunit
VYSFINIFGLALGMAVTIMIGLWVADEFNYNSYFKNKNKIGQLYQSYTLNGVTDTGNAIPQPLEFELRERHAESFEHIVMSSWNDDRYLKNGEVAISELGSFMQEDVVEMLSLEIVAGAKNGLKDPKSIMLSESTATALFGDENPIGKSITVLNLFPMKVTSVYKNIPIGNHFDDLNYIMPWKFYASEYGWVKNARNNWGNNSFQMFVQVADGADMATVAKAIKMSKQIANPKSKAANATIELLPMNDWHLRGSFENGVQAGGRIENVWMFSIIGLFVLILACINFMNLSTARSEKRALEVGIRKSIGSTRSQLIKQFLSESFLVVSIAYILAISFVLLSLNAFNTLASKEMSFPWMNLQFWGISILFVMGTALVSGSYPALYLSSFKPIKVLKGTFKMGRYASLPRKVLVVTQFTVSVALIIGTMIVMRQINYSKNRPSGYDKEGLVQIPTFSEDFSGKYEMMRNQFIASGAVSEMASSGAPTTEVWSNRSGFDWEGRSPDFQDDFAVTEVSYDYAETLNLKLIAGRDFSREFSTDTTSVILNESAVKYMGIQDPIGKYITDKDEEEIVPLKIIGVIEDMVVRSPYSPVKQHLYIFDGDNNGSYYNLRLNETNTVAGNLATIEKVFKTNFPDIPFEYDFIDEQYAAKFRTQERVASLSRVFTGLAILISCLGLFGLASFVAEQRTKEIGVRKVLGASVTNLWMLLSKDFIVLVAIALLIATPLAYYFMSGWIEKFSYRTTISAGIFLIAGSGAIVITIITVSFQAIKAAIANPVKSLRTE